MTRVSIFKKRAENLYLGGFWGEKSRGANGFSIRPFLTLTGPLVKIGGQKLILELYQYWYENILGDLRSFHRSVSNKDWGKFPFRVRVCIK